MFRILIADDHEVVRKGLKQMLSETSDIVVAGEAGNGNEVLDMVQKWKYDLVLLDIRMPGKNGLDVLHELKAYNPKLPVLILSMYPEEQYAAQAFKEGASGYLTKDNAHKELVPAIKKILKGGKYVSVSIAERLACNIKTSNTPAHEKLSEREYQLLCMIASGKSLTSIAENLSLSIKTISTYRVRLLEKLNMKTNAELIRYAIRNRLPGMDI